MNIILSTILTSRCSWLDVLEGLFNSIMQSPFFQGCCLVSISFPNQGMEHYPHKIPLPQLMFLCLDDVPAMFLLLLNLPASFQEHYLHSLWTLYNLAEFSLEHFLNFHGGTLPILSPVPLVPWGSTWAPRPYSWTRVMDWSRNVPVSYPNVPVF